MSTTSASLAFDRLVKRYSGFTAGPITLDVPKGTVCGLIGQNGAGKTTLIRSALGLVRPDSGRIFLFGRNPAEAPSQETLALKQRVASVAAVCPYPGEYTTEDIVRVECGLYPCFDIAYFDALLGRFGLAEKDRDFRHASIKAFSRGQGMQLQIALALATGTELLLLDEPTAGLDPVVREEVLCALREHLAQAPETSVLISSHITSDLESLADRILLMDKGLICFAEDADVLEERFATLAMRTADFEQERGALREAGVTRCLAEGGHVLLLVEDRRRLERAFPSLSLDTLSLDVLLRLAVKGEDL
ncbi:ABC transporter ATP-binding protein [Olsenella sp. Marseille-P4559]|uniref:ABC transporter ATP-binding protein n=1 Tax=Olsenella sp. Marseille-P4559 TaxID=2364795 RepID=UPI0013EF5348|nr:ABC transporter ATP-binding protein [Olsenella sp. Marseille-P4559]